MSSGFTQEAVIAGSVLAYILVTSVMALILRSRTNAQYMVGSRALPAVVIGILLMSEFIGAKSTVGTAQEAFEKGVAAGWSVLAAAIGFLLLGLFFARQVYNSKQHTISGFIEQRFGNGARVVVSLIMIYALLLVNVGNYLSGAAVLTSALHIDLTTSLFLVAAFSAVYYVFGGLKSIAYMTVFHSIFKLSGIAILVVVAAKLTGGVAPIRADLPPFYFTLDGAIGAPTIMAWIVGTVGAIFSTQYIVQAIASNRNAAAARWSVLMSAVLCLPLGFALAFVGVAARYLYPTQDSLYALPVFINGMSAPLASIVTVSLVASVLVSVSTVALAITALVMRDFYVPWRKPGSDAELRATRYVALVVGLVPLLCVFFTPKILELSFFTRALRLSIAIIALIGVYLPFVGSKRSAVAALVASGVATTGWYLADNPFGVDSIYVSAVVPALVLFLDRLFSGPQAIGHKATGAGAAAAVALLVMFGVSPVASAAEVGVNANGTISVPAMEFPNSGLMSAEGNASRVEHILTERSLKGKPQGEFNAALFGPRLERTRASYAVTAREAVMGGVRVIIYEPSAGIARGGRNKVLINVHGGGFVGCFVECGGLESMPIAALTGLRVVSVDYRLAPVARFPAASEDVASVYREILKTTPARGIGLFGCSAGGLLAAQSLVWFQRHDLPRPAAAGIYCAGADPSMAGDSRILGMLLGDGEMPRVASGRESGSGLGYMSGSVPTDPTAYPASDRSALKMFPPTLIVVGTRDFALSSAVSLHSKLVASGVDARLHVWEGGRHAFFYDSRIPESREAYRVMADFFGSRLK